MSRVTVTFPLSVTVDKEEYEEIVGNSYESIEEARAALFQSVRWSLEEGVGGWCDLGKSAQAAASAPVEQSWLNVYVLERLYGGPEEGGWWYDAGVPVLSLEVTDVVGGQLTLLMEALEEKFQDERKRLSVLYPTDGYDYSVVIESEQAAFWPAEQPRYE